MINFTGDLIKVGKGYINPGTVVRFRKEDDSVTYVGFADGSARYFDVSVETFTDAMHKAGGIGDIIDISA